MGPQPGRRPEDVPPRAYPRVQTYNSLEPNLDDFSDALVQIEEFVSPSAEVTATVGPAQPPPTQEVVLPGPVPYPTVSPPLVGYGPAPPGFTRYVFHITSDQRVRVGVDEEGRPTAVRVRERLGVSGRGDYQFAITGPISDVRRAPGSESEPGLRVNQVLWAGFSPGRKVLAADVTLRPRAAAQHVEVHRRKRDEDHDVADAVDDHQRASSALPCVGRVEGRLPDQHVHHEREQELQRIHVEEDGEQQRAIERDCHPIVGVEEPEEVIVLVPEPRDRGEGDRKR